MKSNRSPISTRRCAPQAVPFAIVFAMGCAADGYEHEAVDDESATEESSNEVGLPADVTKTTQAVQVSSLGFDVDEESKQRQSCQHHSQWLDGNYSSWVTCNPIRMPDSSISLGDGLYGNWDMEGFGCWNPPETGSAYNCAAGTWTNMKFDMCPDNTWAIGIGYRGESSQAGRDDSAMNAIWLLCGDRNGNAVSVVSSRYQRWGTDYYWYMATGGSAVTIRGAVLKIEGSAGGGDDTAANRIYTLWGDGTTANLGQTDYGAWANNSTVAVCPLGQAVCGIQTRVEGSQNTYSGGPFGIGTVETDYDDTALNGARFACCRF